MTNTPVAPATLSPKLTDPSRSLFITMHANCPSIASGLNPPGYPVAASVAAHFGNGVYKATIEEAIQQAEMLIGQRRNNGGGYTTAQQNAPVYVLGVVAIVTPTAPVAPPVNVKRFDLPCTK